MHADVPEQASGSPRIAPRQRLATLLQKGPAPLANPSTTVGAEIVAPGHWLTDKRCQAYTHSASARNNKSFHGLK